MTTRICALAAALALLLPHAALAAAAEPEETPAEKMAAFRRVGDIPPPRISVPTVVEIPLERLPFSRAQMAVVDTDGDIFVPYITIASKADAGIPVHVSSSKSRGKDSFLTDRDHETYVDFDLPEGHAGEATLTLTSEEPLTADALWIGLSPHVAMPEKVEIRAGIDGASRIVLAERRGEGVCPDCMEFPKTTASKWQVKLRHGQPLRIAEVSLRQARGRAETQTLLRFLAQPGHAYRVFRDPDRGPSIPAGEAGDLRDDRGVLRLEPLATLPNGAHRESDLDRDGIPDRRDNCVSSANPGQDDIDGNLRGDACDDYDRDGIVNSADNCPNLPNAAQQDADGDKAGDACDGEESRLTEKHAWLPWAALAAAAALMLFFFFRVARGGKTGDQS